MGTFRLYVRFPDGEIWHGCYDSATDTAARFLTPTPGDVAGWAMEDATRCGRQRELAESRRRG